MRNVLEERESRTYQHGSHGFEISKSICFKLQTRLRVEHKVGVDRVGGLFVFLVSVVMFCTSCLNTKWECGIRSYSQVKVKLIKEVQDRNGISDSDRD